VNKKTFHRLHCDNFRYSGIQSLALDAVTSRDWIGMLHIGIFSFKNLSYLDLSHSDFLGERSLEYFRSIATLPQLNTLSLAACYDVPNATFSALAASTALENLDIQFIRTPIDISPKALKWFDDISTIKTLKKIDCRYVSSINTERLYKKIQLPLLNELNIVGCSNIPIQDRKKCAGQLSSIQLIYGVV
jgi:hypothetical protein